MTEEKVYSLVSIETIEKAKKKDTDAFTEIYKAYYSKIYFISKHFFKDDHIAYDIVQEVFIKVYNKLNGLNDSKFFHAWIQRVAYNECLNLARKEKKYIILDDDNTFDDFKDEKQADVSKIIEDKRIMSAIMDSLDGMSIPLKSVGVLRYYEGLPLDEISVVLEIPRGTVSSRLNKIKKALKSDLQRQGISPKNYGVLLFTPGVLHSAYNTLNDICTKGIKEDPELLQKIIGGTAAATGIALKTKLAIGAAVAVALIGGYGIINNNAPKEKEIIEVTPAIAPEEEKEVEKKEDLATITNVSFDNTWTNQNVSVDVQTSNDNYDHILIDGVQTTEVSENGTYIAQLQKDDKIIDEYEFTITNIDRDSPDGYSTKEEFQFTLHLYDDLSNINPQTIVHYRNGNVSHEYYFDETTNTISIYSPLGVHDLFYIYDYAGNELQVEIEK